MLSRARFLWLGCSTLVATLAACSLNPQPEPPMFDPSGNHDASFGGSGGAGSGGMAGAAGSSHGGSGGTTSKDAAAPPDGGGDDGACFDCNCTCGAASDDGGCEGGAWDADPDAMCPCEGGTQDADAEPDAVSAD